MRWDKFFEKGNTSGQVGSLLGQIKAETSRLNALIPLAPEKFKTIAQQTIDQQRPLIDPPFIELIAKEDSEFSRTEDILLISEKRSEWIVWAQNQVVTLRTLNLAITASLLSAYDERESAIMVSNIFHRLCVLDRGRESGWHEIKALAEELKAFDKMSDVAFLAEEILLEREFIERDAHSNNVRLTPLGRQNCAKGIDIPPSDIQRLRNRILL